MVKLDFALFEPAAVKDRHLELVGGRYCTMSGCIAVQLKLNCPKGREYTLYVVRLEGPLDRVPNSRMEIDGVAVQLWKERGVLLGLAGPTL